MPQTGSRPEVLSFKQEVAAVDGRTVAMSGQGPSNDNTKLPDGLLGEVDVAKVWIEGVECHGLVDTGAMVTTVSQKFYEENLRDIPLQPLNGLLKIECASGEHLPYLGYIEVELAIDNDVSDSFPLLVVPDTAYSTDVPMLLGTNVLRPLMKKSREVHREHFFRRWQLRHPGGSPSDGSASRSAKRVVMGVEWVC